MGIKDLIMGPAARPPVDQATAESGRRLLELGRRLLAAAPGWSGGPADQSGLAVILDDLGTALQNIDGRLVLGLLGGTGVGKSTLISALAGEPISASSPVRPTTSRPVVYRHQDFPALTRISGAEVVHQVEALRNVAIIDFPDFDSLETAHHGQVMDHLNDLDLVIWVTDHHKYADRRLYEVMSEVKARIGRAGQAALLNKSDELLALDDGGEALDYLLESFSTQLAEFGGWTGPPPWPVSAAAALDHPGDPTAGGLTPLRELLAGLADAKYRRAIEHGNIGARQANFLARLEQAAQPEQWLTEVKALEELQGGLRPGLALDGDLTALTLSRPAYLNPLVDRLKKETGGLLSLFTDAWDFALLRLKPAPELPPAAPEPSAPGLAGYLAGRSEDLAAITGQSARLNRDELSRQSRAVIQKALDQHLAKAPRVGSSLLIIWPLALAALLIWAESGGQYGGPAALTAAALRSLAPWLIGSLIGDVILSRFVWFRAARHYETAFHRALAQARAELTDLADQSLGQAVAGEIERRVRALDALAEIVGRN